MTTQQMLTCRVRIPTCLACRTQNDLLVHPFRSQSLNPSSGCMLAATCLVQVSLAGRVLSAPHAGHFGRRMQTLTRGNCRVSRRSRIQQVAQLLRRFGGGSFVRVAGVPPPLLHGPPLRLSGRDHACTAMSSEAINVIWHYPGVCGRSVSVATHLWHVLVWAVHQPRTSPPAARAQQN